MSGKRCKALRAEFLREMGRGPRRTDWLLSKRWLRHRPEVGKPSEWRAVKRMWSQRWRER